MVDFAKYEKEDIISNDACLWALESGIKLIGGGVFTLEGFVHIVAIMRDRSRRRVVMKGAQGGGTTLFMLDAIHGLIHGHYPQGVIYYFPTEKSVEAFSKTRFGPLVDDNPSIRRCLKSTKSVSIKRVGDSFLSLLGARPTISIQGKKDSTAVRQTPADYVIRDERDLFDDDMAEQTKQRLLYSTVKKEVDLGTPTIPDFGISKEYFNSDQKLWMVKCEACNEYTCLSEEFPNSVRFDGESPFFCCIKCHRSIYPANGEWVARYPDRDVSGYLVSHFLNANIDLRDVMARWERCQRDGTVGEFYNSILGRPYIAAEDRLSIADVMACCNDEVMGIGLKGTAMGADIGKTNHVVVAEKTDSERAKIIYMARVSGFDALHDIAKKYNVKSAVIDLRPYEESFRKFQAAEKYKVFGCVYQDRMKQFQKTDEKSGIYTLSRTEIFDKTHAWVRNGELEIPRKCAEVDEFAKQMCNAAKVLEENDAGDRRYVYRKLGDEHYRNAVNYLYMALQNLYDYEISPQPVLAGTGKDWNPLNWDL